MMIIDIRRFDRRLKDRLFSLGQTQTGILILLSIISPVSFVLFGIKWLMVIVLVVAAIGLYQYRQLLKDKKRVLFIATTPLPDDVFVGIGDLTCEQKSQLQKGFCEFIALWVSSPPSHKPVAPSQHIQHIWYQLSSQHYQDYGRHFDDVSVHDFYHASAKSKKLTWQLCCQIEDIDPKNPSHLPELFTLDALIDGDGVGSDFDGLQQINPSWYQQVCDVIDLCGTSDGSDAGGGDGGSDGGSDGGGSDGGGGGSD